MSTTPGPVWAKRVADASVGAINVGYCAGRDVQGRPAADLQLVDHDLDVNMAHATMLARAGILDAETFNDIRQGLRTLREDHRQGRPILDPACEDIHMSIEQRVSVLAGPDAGGRLHTARSRNDQVATDMRLWLRERIARDAADIQSLAHAIADHAALHTDTVCPGMTHQQPAMLTTWGHWVASYLPRLLRDLRGLASILPDLRTCPLGAAASFGTTWPILRDVSAHLLGFRHPTPNTADGIWCRGELEAHYGFHIAQFLAHLAAMGQDMILLSSPPRTWLRLPDEFVTGSSIMPQKRNPDFAEVTRARAAQAAGHLQALLSMRTNLPAGYNRDTQWTKYTAMDMAAEADGAAGVFGAVFERLKVDTEAMARACHDAFLNATEVADFIASSRKLPFRQCYKLLGQAVREAEGVGRLEREPLNLLLPAGCPPLTESEWRDLSDPLAIVELRRQPGSPHPAETRRSIDLLLGECTEVATKVADEAEDWRGTLAQLWV